MTPRQFLHVVELRTKVVSISTLALATLYAVSETGAFHLGLFVLTAAATLAVDMGTTAFNSFFDYWRGTDERGDNRERDKVIITEGVPALAAFFVAAGCYAVAALLGALLAIAVGPWVLLVGAASLAVGFLYNGGPAPISRGPFGELFSGGCLGTLLFLIAYRVQAGAWGLRPFLASLPSLLLIASILSTNNACDAEGDRASGRRTLAIVLGPRGAAAAIYALGGTGFTATLALAALGVLPRPCLAAGAVAALAALPRYRRMAARGYSHETKGASMGAVLRVFAVWSLCVTLGLAIGLVAGR